MDDDDPTPWRELTILAVLLILAFLLAMHSDRA